MKRLFDLPFLKKLDDYFLLNHRLLWITKIHYVLFYGILFYAGIFAVVNLYPMSLTQDLPVSGVFAFFATLVALVPAIFWIYKQVVYSIEGNFGQRFTGMELMRAGIYVVFFSLLVGVPFFTGVLVDTKLKNLTTDSEFRADIQKLNIGKGYIFSNNYYDSDYGYSIYNDRNFFSPSYIQCYDCLFNENKVLSFQSVSKNIFFYQPNVGCNPSTNIKNHIKNFMLTARKYGTPVPFELEEAYRAYKNDTPLDFDSFHFDKSHYYSYQDVMGDLRWKLHEIAELKATKTWWNHNVGLFMGSILVFLCANMLLIYKNTSLRSLILAGVTSLGLFLVFIGFVAVVHEVFELRGKSADKMLLGSLFVGYLFFLGQALSIFKRKTFSRFKEISLILVALTTPFLAVYFAAFANAFNYVYIHGFWEIFTVLLVGFGAYIVFALPIFRQLFIKLKALPKE